MGRIIAVVVIVLEGLSSVEAVHLLRNLAVWVSAEIERREGEGNTFLKEKSDAV